MVNAVVTEIYHRTTSRNMTTTRRNHLTSSHDRSPFILERRRKLFPIDDYEDSELGHISPLCSDTTSDSDSEGVNFISDYDVGIVRNKKILGNETPQSTKTCSETMSPLKLSPFTRDTPKKYSPSHNLQTPHDTSTKPVLQKEQKTLLEESKSLKRKSSPSSSPERGKSLKSDYKSSKVRTALFPPENEIYVAMPTKSFYSKSPEDVVEKPSSNRDKYSPKQIKLSTARQSYQYRKKFGQINNGVRHKIRKPKQRKMSKAVIARAAKKLAETGSVLNDYMQDLKELRNKQNTESKLIVNPTVPALKTNVDLNSITKKLIFTPAKQIQTFTEENKENIQNESQHRSVSPPNLSSLGDTKSRKFFKSSRAKPEKVPEKTNDLVNKNSDKDDVKKCVLLTNRSQQSTNNVFFENYDFEDEDVQPEANIDTILSVLSEDSPRRQVVDRSKSEEPVQGFENGCQTAFDLSVKSNSDVFNLLNHDVSKNKHVDNVVDQNEYGNSVQQFENTFQAAFDISKSNYDTLNSLNNVINQNRHETVDIPSCQTVFDTSVSNSDVFVATGCQSIDSRQYLQVNNDLNSLATTHVTGNSRPSFTETPERLDFNLASMYNSNSLEPCVVSSQVVFDNLLLEDGNQTVVNALSNENGPFPTFSNSINPAKTTRTSNYSNRITLEAHNSILASENSIHLHQSKVANMILSPISQMCDVTSGLALNSPKKSRNLSALLNNMSRASKILSFTTSRSADMEQQKLFPVFYPGAKAAPERGEKRERGEVKRGAKKFKALHEDQMLLDAGQKKFGYTICHECNIIYHMGDPGDEIEHRNYHNASHILRFGGWKNEHIVADYQKNGRIIRVLPTDSKIWLKKVTDLMEFVKRDLGCYEMESDITGSQVYLFIKNRTISGCAVATVPREDGHRMLSPVSGVAMCSEEFYPIRCGISHIWVATNFRRQRIATALMDAVKNNFIYGYILTDNDVALTSPTEAGAAFAERYFKTPNYLVYYT